MRILLLLAVCVGAFFWYNRPEPWKRESPLDNPVAVKAIAGGIITLADGRTVTPAGIRKVEGVSNADYDKALRVATAQGVCFARELGEGRALLLVEPKFYNWSETGRDKWPGSYFQCPLSELLVFAGYAAPDLVQPGLTAKEKWRLEGAGHFAGPRSEPVRINDELNAFRYDGSERYFDDEYDTMLEVVWKAPPKEGPGAGSGGAASAAVPEKSGK